MYSESDDSVEAFRPPKALFKRESMSLRQVFNSSETAEMQNTQFNYRSSKPWRRKIMPTQINLGGSFPFPDASTSVNRMGYGAMQLAGPQVWGPPRDKDAAIAVLREALESGVNHIDTSDFYGPQVTNQLI